MAVMAAITTVSLLAHGALAPAYAELDNSLAAAALEEEQQIEADKLQLEYLLQQQDIVRKAELRAQQNALSSQVVGRREAIQKKITEERANALAARKAGDNARAAAIETLEAELEEQQLRLLVKAAKIQDTLSRAEMLERARTQSVRQMLERGAAEAKSEINKDLDVWLETHSSSAAAGAAAKAAR